MDTEEKKPETSSPVAGEEIKETPKPDEAPAALASELPPPISSTPAGVTETATPPLPEELKGWNWGAFFLTWIWAIGNQTYIGLLAIISPLSFIMSIVLGIKGNEWAWENRKFASVDEFKAVQKAWTKWGLIIFIVGIIFAIAMVVLMVVYGVSTAKSIPVNEVPINLNR